MVAAASAICRSPRRRGASHVPAIPKSAENTPATCCRAGVSASRTDRSTLSALAPTESVSGAGGGARTRAPSPAAGMSARPGSVGPSATGGAPPQPPVVIVVRPVHKWRPKFAERAVQERERPARDGAGPGTRQSAVSVTVPPTPRCPARTARTARRAEPLQLKVGVRPTARRQGSLEHQLARSVRALEHQPGHGGCGVGHGQLRGPLEHPRIARQLERQGVDADREGRASRRARASGEPAAGEKRGALADARACQPGERIAGPARRGRRAGKPETRRGRSNPGSRPARTSGRDPAAR